MRTLLDVGAGVTALMVVYAVSGLFISLPDVTPYTYNVFPGSLLVFPVFFLLLYVLRSAWKQRRPYWFVGCILFWPLSTVYYILQGRKEIGHDAQQGAPRVGHRPAGASRP